jgi:hypothetical protein
LSATIDPTSDGFWYCPCGLVCEDPAVVPDCRAQWIACAAEQDRPAPSIAKRMADRVFGTKPTPEPSKLPIDRDVLAAWQRLDDALGQIEYGSLRGFRAVLDDVADARRGMAEALRVRDKGRA